MGAEQGRRVPAYGGLSKRRESRNILSPAVLRRAMPNYRRNFTPGATYFFTVVTLDPRPWLCSDYGRRALRDAIEHVRKTRPFAIDAFVLLPDHLHCVWTLPAGDSA